MKTTTGIHFSGRTLRLVSLRQEAEKVTLIGLRETPLTESLSPQALQEQHPLAVEIRKALSDYTCRAPVVALPGSLFHIQKVPLEMAAENDRREQIIWEANQAMIPPVQPGEIDFLTAGRVAFWTAVRSPVSAFFNTLLAHVSPVAPALVVEPFALFSACQLSGMTGKGRHNAAHLGPTHFSLVSFDGDDLTAAESIQVGEPLLPTASPPQVRQWMAGDAGSDRVGQNPPQTHLCGEPELVEKHRDRLGPQGAFQARVLNPFSNAETGARIPTHPESFAMAAGAAFFGLGRIQ